MVDPMKERFEKTIQTLKDNNSNLSLNDIINIISPIVDHLEIKILSLRAQLKSAEEELTYTKEFLDYLFKKQNSFGKKT